MTVQNPSLSKISDEDNDIMQMIVSGLNTPEDMVNGSNSGTFAAVKASRGPMTDRVSNEIAYFERFLRWDFWDNIFFLASNVINFKYTYKVREAVSMAKQKATFGMVEKKAAKLVEINFPVSDIADMADRTAALFGVKHGSLNAQLGIPNKVLAKKLGFGNYDKLRLEQATEEDKYPELQPEIDQDGTSQESQVEGQKGSGEGKKSTGTQPAKKPVLNRRKPAPAG